MRVEVSTADEPDRFSGRLAHMVAATKVLVYGIDRDAAPLLWEGDQA